MRIKLGEQLEQNSLDRFFDVSKQEVDLCKFVGTRASEATAESEENSEKANAKIQELCLVIDELEDRNTGLEAEVMLFTNKNEVACHGQKVLSKQLQQQEKAFDIEREQ